MIPWLTPLDPFPPVEGAMTDPNGLLAAGADLSTERLLDAYLRGIFPWFGEEDPLLSRSLRRVIRSGRYRVTLDTAFRDVMAGCAEPRDDEGGTWITAEMTAAYTRLATLGFAHSVEVWLDAELVGGLYGVAIGRMFYGESMFSRCTDASKVALVTLARQLERWGFEMIDCQMATGHLASLGACEIPRAKFVEALQRLAKLPPIKSPWTLDLDLYNRD